MTNAQFKKNQSAMRTAIPVRTIKVLGVTPVRDAVTCSAAESLPRVSTRTGLTSVGMLCSYSWVMHRRCHFLRDKTQDSADSEGLLRTLPSMLLARVEHCRQFDVYVELFKSRYSANERN
jgi:hypothetical protein